MSHERWIAISAQQKSSIYFLLVPAPRRLIPIHHFCFYLIFVIGTRLILIQSNRETIAVRCTNVPKKSAINPPSAPIIICEWMCAGGGCCAHRFCSSIRSLFESVPASFAKHSSVSHHLPWCEYESISIFCAHQQFCRNLLLIEEIFGTNL